MKSDAFRRAAEAKDFSSFDEMASDDLVFRSPVVYKPYEGRDAVRVVLAAVVQVFEDFRYEHHIESGDRALLEFTAKVNGREVQGVDILDFDSEGKIEALTVLIRPMSGLTALAEAMRAMLEVNAGGIRGGGVV